MMEALGYIFIICLFLMMLTKIYESMEMIKVKIEHRKKNYDKRDRFMTELLKIIKDHLKK